MKVIFLDIDGVLNSRERWQAGHCIQIDPHRSTSMIDPSAMWLLKMILVRTGAKLVLTSAWRLLYSLEELEEMFSKHFGLNKGLFVGSTGRYGRRNHEISKWLEENRERLHIDDYLILDDDPDAAFAGHVYHKNTYIGSRTITTDWVSGLQRPHTFRAIAILEGHIQPAAIPMSSPKLLGPAMVLES